MKKRWIAILLAVLCVAGVSLRIWIVNRDNEPQLYKTYSMNEVVPFEDDFFYSKDEIRDGYDIEVLSARVMTIEEYLDEIGKTEEEWEEVKGKNGVKVPYVYDVEVRIRNHVEEENNQYIDLINTALYQPDNFYQVDSELLWMRYPTVDTSSFGFRVLPGTETVVHLPYHVLDYDVEHYGFTFEKVKNSETYLLLSMYPVKKMIEIIPE